MVEYDPQYVGWYAGILSLFPDGTTDTELFDDDDVHNVLYNSGFSAPKFSNLTRTASRCRPLPFSKRDSGGKEGRTALTAAEKSEVIFCMQVPCCAQREKSHYPVDEDGRVNQTLRCSGRKTRCRTAKMRFGKRSAGLCARSSRAGYQKVIVSPTTAQWKMAGATILTRFLAKETTVLSWHRFDTISPCHAMCNDARNDATPDISLP